MGRLIWRLFYLGTQKLIRLGEKFWAGEVAVRHSKLVTSYAEAGFKNLHHSIEKVKQNLRRILAFFPTQWEVCQKEKLAWPSGRKAAKGSGQSHRGP